MRCRSGCGPGGLTVVVFSAALLAAGPRVGAAAMLFGMGDLPGGETSSGAWAVSHDGSVAVGYSTDVGQYPPRPVYWRRGDGLVQLRDPAGAPIPGLAAVDVSGDGGLVIGPGNNDNTIFRWNRSTRAIEYFTFSSTAMSRVIRGASADGSVVVGIENLPDNHMHAFRWTQAGGMTLLPRLAGGLPESHAVGVSADGSLVAGNAFDDDTNVPLTWLAGAVPRQLPVPAGYRYAVAQAISPSGALIAGAVGNPDGTSTPVMWRGQETTVFTAPPGATGGGATYAVSDNGVIVGLANLADGSHAALWDAAHGGRWLSDVLSEAGVNVSGWRFITATDVSADGMTIVGYGTNPRGEAEGFIAVLPEPAATAPFLAVAPLLRRRRR